MFGGLGYPSSLMQKLTGKKAFLNLDKLGREFVFDLFGNNIHILENIFYLEDKFYYVGVY